MAGSQTFTFVPPANVLPDLASGLLFVL